MSDYRSHAERYLAAIRRTPDISTASKEDIVELKYASSIFQEYMLNSISDISDLMGCANINDKPATILQNISITITELSSLASDAMFMSKQISEYSSEKHTT